MKVLVALVAVGQAKLRLNEASCDDPPCGPTVPTANLQCRPTCRWHCDDPICEQTCEPKCASPVCKTFCQHVDDNSCQTTCEEPKCTVICPAHMGQCKGPDCKGPNKCTTVCGAPECKTQCARSCESKCADPVCQYECEKPKECPQPRCQMVCDHDACPGFPDPANSSPRGDGVEIAVGTAKLGNIQHINKLNQNATNGLTTPGAIETLPANLVASHQAQALPVPNMPKETTHGEAPGSVSSAPAQMKVVNSGPPPSSPMVVPESMMPTGKSLMAHTHKKSKLGSKRS